MHERISRLRELPFALRCLLVCAGGLLPVAGNLVAPEFWWLWRLTFFGAWVFANVLFPLVSGLAISFLIFAGMLAGEMPLISSSGRLFHAGATGLESIALTALAVLGHLTFDYMAVANPLLGSVKELAYLSDRQGHLVWRSARARRLAKSHGRPTRGRLAWAVPEQYREAAKKYTQEAFERGHSGSETFFIKDFGDSSGEGSGGLSPMFARSQTITYRGRPHVLSILYPVTGPDFSERLFATALNAVDTAIAIRALDYRLLWCNTAFAKPLKQMPDELRGSTTPAYCFSAPVMKRALHRPQMGEPYQIDLEAPDGRLLAWEFFPVVDGNHQVVATISLSRDVTERRENDRRVAQAQRLALIGQLAAGIAHNVNNIFGAITVNAELLKRTGDEATALRAANITRALDQGSAILERFCRLSTAIQATLESVDVAPILERTRQLLELQAARQGVQIAVDTVPGLCARADATHLQQVLLNLGLNGLQAMPAGGTLRFTTRLDGAARLSISVQDTGSGIQPENLPQLFTPFFTTSQHNGGTGLGLATSLAMMHAMSGDIQVESTPGAGSSFRLSLPCA
ncbi:MAG TPA: ATP-binding protein [Symbiobacteriaceae bacterium]